jgi:hypothetical protein
VSTTLRAFVVNPEFPAPPPPHSVREGIRALATPDAYDDFVKEVPVTFVVPDACNAVDLSYEPIEIVPGVGTYDDYKLAILPIGRAKVESGGQPVDPMALKAGQQITVVVPWAFISLAGAFPAGRLRMKVVATFYDSTAK